jgi:hypothetical protein
VDTVARWDKKITLLVTDYTENSQFDNNDKYPENGPLGRRSMHLVCWYGQCESARALLALVQNRPNGGHFWPVVRIINARTKLVDDVLTAQVKDDMKYPAKLFIRKAPMDDLRVKELLRRDRADREEMQSWSTTPPSSQEYSIKCSQTNTEVSSVAQLHQLKAKDTATVRVRLRDFRPYRLSDAVIANCPRCLSRYASNLSARPALTL